MIIQSSCILPRIPSCHCQWDQVPPSLWMAVSLLLSVLGVRLETSESLTVWQHPSFALQPGLWQCLKFQVWNLFSPSTLKILIQLTLKYSCGIENFMSIDSESFAPFADHFGVSLWSYPKLPSHCLPTLWFLHPPHLTQHFIPDMLCAHQASSETRSSPSLNLLHSLLFRMLLTTMRASQTPHGLPRFSYTLHLSVLETCIWDSSGCFRPAFRNHPWFICPITNSFFISVCSAI